MHMQDNPKDIDTRLRSVRENADGTIVISEALWNRGRSAARPNRFALTRHAHHWRTHYAPASPPENFLHHMLQKLGLRRPSGKTMAIQRGRHEKAQVHPEQTERPTRNLWRLQNGVHGDLRRNGQK